MTKAGQRCRKHKGMPEAGPRQAKASQKQGTGSATSRGRSASHGGAAPRTSHRVSGVPAQAATNRKQTKRVEEAAKLCGEVITDGWQLAVASGACDYVSKETWEGLFNRRAARHCKVLAHLAADVLAGKKQLHDWVGAAGGWMASMFGAQQFERALAKELAAKLPLPWDTKVVAVARGMQVTGVLVCVAEGRDVGSCRCFADLAAAETKTVVKKILATAVGDWARLGEFPPSGRPALAGKV